MIDRYGTMFERLSSRGEAALVPFFMLGDAGIELIGAAIDAGADALELGIPFSDPVADGPLVAQAANRALAAGATPASCLAQLEALRAAHPDIPMGLLTYANPVFTHGLDGFYASMAAAGVDSVLVADLPLREADAFRDAAHAHGVAQVFILPSDADAVTREAIAGASEGYVYVLGRRGVTGVEHAPGSLSPDTFEALRRAGAPPALVGFGVSTPAHVHLAGATGAAGVIVGSALMQAAADGQDVVASIVELKDATRWRAA